METTEQMKARAYDIMKQQALLQAELQSLHAEIAKREQEPDKKVSSDS